MKAPSSLRLGGLPLILWALPMLMLLLLPIVALVTASSPADILAGMQNPVFAPALWLSTKTSLISLVIVLVTGTPLAWWLAKAPPSQSRFIELLVDLPIVLPPAVLGIALLQTFGRQGLLGDLLMSLGIQIPFSTSAVVLAQVVVSAPFYIGAAASAFRRVNDDLLLVARTLGQNTTGAFIRVALPLALPGIISGAALCWARALGEFGATLLFAGNLSTTTQTMPLAIYTALESDVRAAIAISLVLMGVALILLLALRLIPALRHKRHLESSKLPGVPPS